MKKIEAAIFDMDGVLVDSEKAFKHACSEALHQWGVYPEYSEFVPYTGMGDIIYIGAVSAAHGVPYTTEMTDVSYKLYKEYSKTELKVFPWSRKIIEEIAKKGAKVAVASSAGLFKVETNLEAVGVDKSILTAFVTGDDVEKKKPEPDIFLCAAKKCAVLPENCIVFEDAISGVRAAKAAGMTAVAVTSSFSEKELISAGADYVCDDLMEAFYKFFAN
ncbi:MAG: HAD family hydrolase [Ruminococcaceae bacterium]|nr:HAD family hydrolase [Oscillospiraceae bacterium]